MPDVIEPPVETFPNAEANNAEVKTKLESQGVEALGGATDKQLQDSGSALDDLLKAVVEAKEPDPVVDPPPAKPDPTPEELAAAKAAEDQKAALSKSADDLFKDSPALPPNASPKSSEAFSSIKIRAAQEISTRDQKIAEYEKELTEAREKLKNAVPPETLKELEDHRQWRAKLDVEADPKFKEFDKQVSTAQEFIYAQLSKSPAITPDIIAQIKKHGGPENVNLDKILAVVKDPTLERIVQAKVADIEQAKWNKEQAIRGTKENIAKYLEDQQKAYTENVGAHNKRTETHFVELAAKMPWYQEKQVDPKADEPTRKAAEAHNKFVTDTRAQLKAALNDDSPEMRALMLTGMGQLLHIQRAYAGQSSQIESLQKELTAANEKLAKFSKASTSRLRESGAPPSGGVPKPKEADIFNVRANESLDEIAKQITAERAAKASA